MIVQCWLNLRSHYMNGNEKPVLVHRPQVMWKCLNHSHSHQRHAMNQTIWLMNQNVWKWTTHWNWTIIWISATKMDRCHHMYVIICNLKELVYLSPLILNVISFLWQVKDDLGSVKYGQLLQAFEKYDADGDYGLCRETLFNLYPESDFFNLIKALTVLSTFFKPEHRTSFEKDAQQKFSAVKN